MPEAVLQTHDLAIGYSHPARRVASAINVTLEAGELVCLLGPNGAGKSTLLRTLAGMHTPLQGSITLLGRDPRELSPRERARLVSVVLTERIDADALTAYELVALGRYPHTDWSARLTPRDHAMVMHALETLDILDLAPRDLNALSDGERQKVMIARALAQEPTMMILDEPTAFLDLPRRVEVMRVLRSLTATQDRAVLLSTHDLDLALRNADQIWLLPHGGPLTVGAPEDLVLGGALEAAFRGQGLAFDPSTAAFTSSPPRAGQVTLIGDGLVALWTARALERAGYSHQNGSCSTRITVIGEDSPRWRVSTPEGERDCRSLHAVIAYLRTTGNNLRHSP